MTAPTTIKLDNGIRIANFSSPHSFRFNTGEELPACSAVRAKSLMLKAEECEFTHPKGWTDIALSFRMTVEVWHELQALVAREDIDVLLVPFPVITAMRDHMASFAPDPFEAQRNDQMRAKVRTIRSADRVTKTIYSDRFCR